MTTTTAPKTLRDYQSSTAEAYPHTHGTRYTDPDTGAWVEVVTDPDPVSPLEWVEGVHVAYPARSRYGGNAEDIPADMAVRCRRCDGCGDDPKRWQVTRHHGAFGAEVTASGTFSAMEFVAERAGYPDGDVSLTSAPCTACNGNGERETEDVCHYVRRERDALGAVEFSTGQYGEIQAVLYVSANDDAWTDPQAAAEAFAEEYRKWTDGDVWGIVSGDTLGEDADGTCWGFIGDDHAEAEALETLRSNIAAVETRREANIIRGCE